MRVTFSSPQAEFALIRDEWLREVEEIAARGVFVGGVPVTRFEEAFASYSGAQYGIGVANGTDAIYLTLKALDIGPGDEVITAANTFIATVEAIHHTGALPVLADCDPDTFLIDLEQAKRLVTPRTKAIIPVHLYGQMVDLTTLIPWAEERGIAVVEDSAQAAGASLFGRKAGNMGTSGCFSFYPDKNLGALGDGGAIITSDPELATGLRKWRNHGGEVRYQHEFPGVNSRLDPIQAAALRLKLAYLDEWSRKRREVAGLYESYLGNCSGVKLPGNRGDESHVYHLYVIRIEAERRDTLKKQLQKHGVLTAIQYPEPIHRMKAFAHLGYQAGDFPASEEIAGEILSLPMNIALTEEDVAGISAVVRDVLGKVQI